MSFLFNWSDLQKIDFKSIINDALSQFNIPQFPNKLQLKALNIDHVPPVLKILKIQEFSTNKLQLQIKFKYDGELELNLTSKLEINALNLIDFDDFTKPHFVMSNRSTVIPIDFKLSDFKIDSIMTFIFIKKVNKLILIFNEDPFIEFNIQSSIDELLDEEIILEIKNDTLKLCVDFIKHDLPLIVNGYSIIEGMDTIKDIQIEDNTQNMKPIRESNDSRNEVFSSFNTLSLMPPSFDNVLERINLRTVDPEVDLNTSTISSSPEKLSSIKKKRVIKMNNKTKHKHKNKDKQSAISPTSSSFSENSHSFLSLSPLPFHESTIDSPTLIDTSIDLKIDSIDDLTNSSDHLLGTPEFSNSTFDLSLPSTPLNDSVNIFNNDSTETNDALEYHSNNDNYSVNDPYQNILHPLDILPSFQQLTNSLNKEYYNDNSESKSSSTTTSCIFEFDSIEENSEKHEISRRRTSSNYINLNEFKSKLKK